MFVDTRGDIPLQGDIFTRIPFAVHLPGGDTFGHPNSPAMLLSHECDIAKPNNEIALLAVVRSAVDSINQDNLGHLRSRRLFHAFYLDDPPGLDGRDWYADCRFITAVHKDMLDLNHRLASLSDESREALRGHVIKFWNRTG